MAQWFNIDFLRNSLSLFNHDLMLPDRYVRDINEINWEDLKKDKGIEGVIFDADNTLTVYEGNSVHHSIIKSFEKSKKIYGSDKLVILSNYTGNGMEGSRERRIEEIKANLGIRVVASSKKKPAIQVYNIAVCYIGTQSSATAMIGDTMGIDILGARKAGLGYTVLVDPLDPQSDPLYLKFARHVERFWYRKELARISNTQ